MQVAIAGGNGAIARQLTRLLVGRGDHVRSLVRRREQLSAVEQLGAEPVLCDLEAAEAEQLAAAVGAGSDAVVFAAGAGPGSGAARKETVDYGGAVKLIEAARRLGVHRYLMVSSVRADANAPGDEVFDVYLRAKGRADDELRASGLDHTIVRPVRLTDEPGTGRVRVGDPPPGATIPREDVAAVLLAALDEPATIGATFDVAAGDTPVEEAVRRVG